VIHHQVLRFSGSIALDRYDNSRRLTLNATGIFLEKSVVAIVTCKLKLLVLIHRSCIGYEPVNLFRPLEYTLHCCALPSDVVGQVVQPPRVVSVALAIAIAASVRCHVGIPLKSAQRRLAFIYPAQWVNRSHLGMDRSKGSLSNPLTTGSMTLRQRQTRLSNRDHGLRMHRMKRQQDLAFIDLACKVPFPKTVPIVVGLGDLGMARSQMSQNNLSFDHSSRACSRAYNP
jgi:hypothetical protein